VCCQDGTLGIASEFDMEKVRTTLKQIVRDWSDDGAAERSACYQPVIDEIVRLFPNDGRFVCNVSDNGFIENNLVIN